MKKNIPLKTVFVLVVLGAIGVSIYFGFIYKSPNNPNNIGIESEQGDIN